MPNDNLQVNDPIDLTVVDPAAGTRRGARPFDGPPDWRALLWAGLASSLLGVLLTLAVLALLNRGLAYASPADVRALQARVDGLQTQVEAQTAALSGLTSRVEQLEELAARTSELERMALQLQGEIDKRVNQAEELKASLAEVQEKISDVVIQSSGFQKFVDSLRATWQTLFPGNTPP